MAGFKSSQARASNGRWSRTGAGMMGRTPWAGTKKFVNQAIHHITKQRFTRAVPPGSARDAAVRVVAVGVAGAMFGPASAPLNAGNALGFLHQLNRRSRIKAYKELRRGRARRGG